MKLFKNPAFRKAALSLTGLSLIVAPGVKAEGSKFILNFRNNTVIPGACTEVGRPELPYNYIGTIEDFEKEGWKGLRKTCKDPTYQFKGRMDDVDFPIEIDAPDGHPEVPQRSPEEMAPPNRKKSQIEAKLFLKLMKMLSYVAAIG